MAVTNPASFSSIKAEFAGSANFSDYYRGGPYVSSGNAAAISTTAAGLAMSQFNGVTKVSGLSATASPNSVSATTATNATITTNSTTCTPTGGSGAGYTYAWEYVSGDSTASIATPSAAATQFTATVNNVSGTKITTFRCKVTDSAGNVAYSNNVGATFNYTGTVS